MNIKKILAWSFYDFATSAYFAVILTFVFATYFTSKIATNAIEGTELWGETLALSAFLIAFVSPILGAIADYGRKSKPYLVSLTYLGIIATSLLFFGYPTHTSTYLVLACLLVSNFSLETAGVFYNAYLPHLASKEYIGRVSGWAWGFGYFGGLSCLIITLLVFVNDPFQLFSKTPYLNIRAIALLVGAWLFVFSCPLFLVKEHERTDGLPIKQATRKGLRELLETIKSLYSRKNLFYFLIARMFYIDGLNALLALGGIYGVGTFNLGLSSVLLFGIIINITAGIGVILFAWLDDYLGSKPTILISLLLLIISFSISLVIRTTTLLWIIAPFIGLFVGPIQGASRTLMARLIKPEEVNRMYGLYAFTGKATSFMGPLVVGLVTNYSQNQRVGMAMLLPFFLIGGGILLFLVDENPH